MKRLLILSVTCSMLLTACITAKYGEQGLFGGGMKSEWLSDNSLSVTTRASSHTNEKKIADMTKLWIAEEAKAKDFKYFHIKDLRGTKYRGGDDARNELKSLSVMYEKFPKDVNPKEVYNVEQVISTFGPIYKKENKVEGE